MIKRRKERCLRWFALIKNGNEIKIEIINEKYDREEVSLLAIALTTRKK